MPAEGTRLGTGYVAVEPDFSRFQELLGKRLSKALGDASLGKEFARAFSRGVVGRGTQSVGRDIARSVTASTGEALRDTRNRAVVERQAKEFALHTRQAVARSIAKGGPDPKEMATGIFGDQSEWRASMQDVSRRVTRDHERIVNRTYESMGQTLDRVRKDAARKAARNLIRDPVLNDPFGVERARRSARSRSRFEQDIEASQRLTDRLRALGAQFRALRRDSDGGGRSFTAFSGGMSRINRSFTFLRNILRTLKWPLLIASVGLAAQGLSALAAGAVAATSALGPLAGSLVVLPAAALAAAQAIGTLKLATAGVGDAIKASLDVEVQGGEQAADAMRRQQDAAEQVADAKRNLTSVQRQAHFAQEDLTEARQDATRELEDMREAADRSHESEEQATLSLRQARQELNRTLNDVDATGLDIRLAESDVDSARADLQRTRTDAKRARQDFRDAQKQGVEGMPQVVAAKRAEEDAVQAVEDAQRGYERAIRDSTAAMEEQGSAATSLQQKMSQLPVAARAFVREVVGLKPKLDALRSTAASGFFPGAAKGLHALLKNFGPVKAIVGETAQAFGNLAERAGKQLGSAEWGRDLRKLGKGNTRLLERMGEATMNLADGFRHILVAAQPFLDWLGESTVKFTEWIDESAEAGRETGRLADFFDRVREAMELTGPILKGVGGALLGIGQAARPVGNEILESLGDAAEGWREWTESTEGQNNLRRYFRESKPAIDEMGRLLRDVGKAFFELGRQEGVAELLRLVRTELVPALTDLVGATTGFAADFLEQFGRLRREGVPTFEAFLTTLADKAGEAGGKIIKALWNAFWGAGIWGKIAIGGFFLSKFGALSAFGKWGAKAGARLGESLFKSAAKWIAGTQAGTSLLGWFQGTFSRNGRFGKAAGTAGTRMGRLFGQGFLIGAAVGLVALIPAVRTLIIEPIKREIEEQLGGVGGAIVDGIEFATETAAKGLGGTPMGEALRQLSEIDSGFEIPEPKTDKAERAQRRFETSTERMRKGVGRGWGQIRKDARKALDPLPGVAGRSGKGMNRQMQPELDRLRDRGGDKLERFAERGSGSYWSLSTAGGRALGTLMENTNRALKALGVKVIGYTVKGLPNTKGFVKGAPKGARRQDGGEVPLATGGLASVVPGNLTGDRHVLSLNGKPVAKVESKEGIFVGNRKMMAAAEKMNDRFPRFGPPKMQAGGIVGLGKQLQREGYEVGEHPAFGGVGGHAPGSYHYSAQALDINDDAPPYASGSGEPGSLDRLNARLKKMPGVVELLWRTADHFDHLHVALGKGASGALGFLGGAFSLPKQKLLGPDGPLRDMGQAAVDRVHKAAREFVNAQSARTGREPSGAPLSGSGNVERVFAEVAKRLSRSKTATLALGMAGFAESGMRDLGYGHSTSEGALQLLSSTAAGLGVDPHDEAAVASLFLTRGFWGKGGANALAAQGLPAHLVAQNVQGSAFSDGSNYLAQEGSAKGWMRRFGLKVGGMLKLMLGGSIPGLQGGGHPGSGKAGKRKYAPMQRHLARLKGLGLGSEALEAFGDRMSNLTGLSERSEQFSEWASNASALTFEGQDGNTIQGEFQGGTEGSWLLQQLQALGSLRNELIAAHAQFTEMRKRLERMVAQAKRQIEAVKRQIRRAMQRKRKLQASLRQARQNLSAARDIKDPKRRRRRVNRIQKTIGGIGERIRVLGFRQTQRNALRGHLEETLTDRLEPRLDGVKTALLGTMDGGSTEDGRSFAGLKQVQGLSGPMHEITGPLGANTPALGTLGGEILSAQSRLRAIDEEGKARADDGDSTEREGLLEELLRQANQRTAVEARLGETLKGFELTYPRGEDLTKFHDGGTIIGPANREVPIMARVGESVLDEETTAALAAGNGPGGLEVVVNGDIVQEKGDSRDPVEVVLGDRRFAQAVRSVRGTGRNSPSGQIRGMRN